MSDTEESFDIFASIGAIYLLNKTELMERMLRLGINTEGTMKELRTRFSTYIKEARARKSTQNLCEEMEKITIERACLLETTNWQMASQVNTSGITSTGSDKTPEPQGYTNYYYPVPSLPVQSSLTYTTAAPSTTTTIPNPGISYPAVVEYDRLTKQPEYRQWYYPYGMNQNQVSTPTAAPVTSQNQVLPTRETPNQVVNKPSISREAEVMNVVRKWGVKFDGTGNALEFI